jgi:hypothetical protein
MQSRNAHRLAIFLKTSGCEDLVFRKVYRVLADEKAEKSKHLRIIDESGEDYLYPASYFFVFEVPRKIERCLTAAAL